MKETNTSKPFIIPKQLVMKAYKLVKENRGSAGIDQQSLEDFDKNLKSNLYKIWNRLSSGSYFPPAVKAVSIPKKSGGERILGIPTVSDRIAQMVVKLVFEPEVEPFFYPDSYGYRPNKSALEAVGVTRQRCWKCDWVLEYDIKGLFDNIDHDLLMKAVRKHTKNKWVILYIERWLKAPIQTEEGVQIQRDKGTPQGGVISPVLSNLFLHYVFDAWMKRNFPNVQWCRYADDGLVHCRTEGKAQLILEKLTSRFKECGLELHPDKTKIVYCKDANRQKKYPTTSFTFLGYDFRPRESRNIKLNKVFLNFSPALSKAAGKAMRKRVKKSGIGCMTELNIRDIAEMFNPILRGWIQYYGHYARSGMKPVWRHFDHTLIRWAMRKHKKLRGRKMKAVGFINKIRDNSPQLFEHWKQGMTTGV